MLYRCLACHNICDGGLGLDFEADEPRCPSCKLGPPVVVERETVHYLFAHADGRIPGFAGSKLVCACDPSRSRLGVWRRERFHASGDPHAVTCPKCMATEAFKEHKRLMLEAGAIFTPNTELNPPGACGGCS